MKAKTTEFLKKKSRNMELWGLFGLKKKRMARDPVRKRELLKTRQDDRKFEGKYDRTLRD